MVYITSDELAELQECVSSLKTILARLDRIGAGIAAIHVDAAIEQLANNINVNAPHGLCSDDLALLFEHECCEPPRKGRGFIL